MSSRALITAAVFCCLLAMPAERAWPQAGGEDAPFFRRSLVPEGKPDLEVFQDFDGDRICDVLLVDDRTFTLFISGPDGPEAAPTRVMRAPDDAVLLDVADLDRDKAREIVVLKRDGVYVLRPAAGGGEEMTAERVIAGESTLIPRRVRALTFTNFVRDITGDGPEDIVFPCLDRLVIHAYTGPLQYEKWCEIPYRPRAEFHEEPLSETGGRRETLHVPLLMAGGSLGPEAGHRIVLYDGTWVRIVKRGEDGIGRELSARSLYDTKTQVAADRDLRMRFHSNVYFDDLDKDGRGDLVVVDNSEGELLFFTGIDAEQPAEHSLAIRTDGSTFQPVFTDLNNDGYKDLILPSVGNIGLFTILKVFFTSKFDMSYMVFFNRREPLFRITPDDSRTLSFPLSFSTTEHGMSVESVLIHSFQGDFNGDGRNDLLLRGQKKNLNVFFGREDGTFSEEADMTFEVDIVPDCFSVRTRTEDVNGDGRADIYLHQKSEKTEQWDIYLSRF
jgi:hypothetical protein